jgi:UDP-N-acetylmuramoyl-tripeptide--D-alanyl-D-alanine ligase
MTMLPDAAQKLGQLGKKPLVRWTLAQVAVAAGAAWRLPARFDLAEVQAKRCLGATLDSRTAEAGEVFVPLRGARADGHDFLAEARAHGVIACLCRGDRAAAVDLDRSGPLLVVDDAEAGLQRWGAARRAAWVGTVVAVTGTAGKTTAKEMLAAVLVTAAPTHATAGNRNNQLGVPVTLTGLSDDHRYAVVEMGMNHRGEIARYCEWARPQVGVITHVGAAHLEGLGSIDEVARAKAELAASLPEDGTLIVPADNEPLRRALAEVGVRARTVSFSLEGPADVVAEAIADLGPAGTSFRVAGYPPVRLRLAGRHQVKNALAALAVARALGVEADAAVAALGRVAPLAGRGEVAVWNGVTVLLDHYNANPDSMRAALETLRRWPARRRYAALGEMREMGVASAAAHREVGVAAAFVDGLFLTGENTAHVAEGALSAGLTDERVRGFPTPESLGEALAAVVRAGDVVLVKGSRGARMEGAADRLRAGLAAAGGGEG